MAGRIVVGTSSWADQGFVDRWYPPKMPSRDRLPWYAQHFEAVEVNSSFYAVPEQGTVRRWTDVTPDGFTFHWKLHKLLSRHSAQLDSLPPDLREQARTNERGRVLLDPEIEAAVCDEVLAASEPLRERGKMGAYLLQLTPAFAPGKHELTELDPLIERLSPAAPVAVELRHRGWVDEDRVEGTLAYLSDRDAVFVGVDAPREEHVPIMPSDLDAVTRDGIAYLRLHGRDAGGYMHGKTVAERFGWRYSDEELEEVIERSQRLAEEAGEAHVLFNNNRDDDAPTAAARMRALLGQAPEPRQDAGEQLRLM